MKTLDASAIFWRKASFSTNTGGQCVEIAAMWRSHSTDLGGRRVEVAAVPQMAAGRED
ncbi:hypothetical protein GCM10023195_53970 [Actinoallomurus liliacearum]|uniref:DUF397 domain-containing protein n=1 Tax=Actinoallomurus liliacearum TaxID=1080073 RepID=A0ABP8TNU2_9ACTN